jgi:Prokaryotic Cytochrome C oxidase subunit IV
MLSFLSTRASTVWLALVAATMLSWEIRTRAALTQRAGSTIILVIAFSKVLGVIFEFMEIRWAPLAARVAAIVWATAMCAVLTALYLMTPT